MKLRYIISITFLTLAASGFLIINNCNSATQSDSYAQAHCVFCKIVAGQEPAKVIAENEDVLVFQSIAPRYPSHWLIIPKKHIKDLKSAQPDDTLVLGKLLKAAGDLGKQLQEPKAFNIQINEGAQAGQTVFHLHLHFHSQSKLATNNPKI